MNQNELREYLRNLQKSPYQWPNDYFAWEKPDKSLFMIGIRSSQMYELIKHEINSDSWHNKVRAQYGEPMEYSSVLYGISPNISYMQGHMNGPAVPYDPVERLVQEVASYRFLGSWRDPDILMESPTSYSKTLACGRWELAKKHILQPEKKVSLNEKISQAAEKSALQASQTPSKEKDLALPNQR